MGVGQNTWIQANSTSMSPIVPCGIPFKSDSSKWSSGLFSGIRIVILRKQHRHVRSKSYDSDIFLFFFFESKIRRKYKFAVHWLLAFNAFNWEKYWMLFGCGSHETKKCYFDGYVTSVIWKIVLGDDSAKNYKHEFIRNHLTSTVQLMCFELFKKRQLDARGN